MLVRYTCMLVRSAFLQIGGGGGGGGGNSKGKVEKGGEERPSMLCSLKLLIITPYYTMIFEVPCGMRNACRIYLDYLYSNCNQVSPALKDQEKKYINCI